MWTPPTQPTALPPPLSGAARVQKCAELVYLVFTDIPQR